MIDFIKKILERPPFAKYAQFIKFGMVGVSSTIISYGLDQLGFYVLFAGIADERVRVWPVSALAFALSVVNSYFWNNRYVFAGGKKTAWRHVVSYLRTAACYALTGLIISPLAKHALIACNVEFWIASMIPMAISIPINYLTNKFWAFRPR